jgi:hypothetical protein
MAAKIQCPFSRNKENLPLSNNPLCVKSHDLSNNLVLLHKTTSRKRGLLQNPHWKRFSEMSFLKIVPSTLYVEEIPPMNLKHN